MLPCARVPRGAQGGRPVQEVREDGQRLETPMGQEGGWTMIEIALAALVGAVRTFSLAALVIVLAVCLYQYTAIGLSLVAAFLAYYFASRLASRIDSQVSDVDTPPDGEEDYHT